MILLTRNYASSICNVFEGCILAASGFAKIDHECFKKDNASLLFLTLIILFYCCIICKNIKVVLIRLRFHKYIQDKLGTKRYPRWNRSNKCWNKSEGTKERARDSLVSTAFIRFNPLRRSNLVNKSPPIPGLDTIVPFSENLSRENRREHIGGFVLIRDGEAADPRSAVHRSCLYPPADGITPRGKA